MSANSTIPVCGVDLSGYAPLIGPLSGNVIILLITGSITVGCFAVMLWLLWRPGETQSSHPKFTVLRHDR